MIDFATIQAVFVKIADIAKGLKEHGTQIKVNEVAINLQGAIIDLQTQISSIQAEYQDVLGRNKDLEQQLVEYDQWKQESARYSLTAVSPGGFVYALNPSDSRGEPQHWLCTNCYRERKKSVLQQLLIPTRPFGCPRCNATIIADRAP